MKTFKQHLIAASRRPTIFRGKNPEVFKEWIRSKSDLSKMLNGKLTISKISRLAIDERKVLDERIVIDMPVDEVWRYREYDRARGAVGSNNTVEQWDALLKSIMKEGIKEPLMISIEMVSNRNQVEVILGEGNNRLWMARMLKIKTVPVRFYYKGFG